MSDDKVENLDSTDIEYVDGTQSSSADRDDVGFQGVLHVFPYNIHRAIVNLDDSVFVCIDKMWSLEPYCTKYSEFI